MRECAFYRPFNITSVTSSWITRNTKGVECRTHSYQEGSYLSLIRKENCHQSSGELALAHHIKRKTKNAYAHAQVDADAVTGVLIVSCFGFTGPLSSITVFIKRFFRREADRTEKIELSKLLPPTPTGLCSALNL